MANEIISYIEMCRREGASLQRGMNFELGHGYSVILMSTRANAPYLDRLEEDGSTLIYEGHDVVRSDSIPNPKAVDQPGEYPNRSLTQNGLFLRAALACKEGRTEPHLVRVYEKIHSGIWSYNGIFQLIDGWRQKRAGREVFCFKLVAVVGDESTTQHLAGNQQRRRMIPTAVKIEVWKRDNGRCVVCGATNELHFDHDLPYSKGGTSMRSENVQLLCARHNLSKGGKIL
jgi:hypothetical protein